MRTSSHILQFTVFAVGAMWMLLSGAGAVPAPAPKQRHFVSPRAAIDTLVAALRKDDMATLEAALGPDSVAILYSGDDVDDNARRDRFLAAYDARSKLIEQGPNKVHLAIGADEWPFPIPLTRDAQGWRLDTAAGREELRNRRIGQNEMNVIQVSMAYVDAQREYASVDRDGDKLNEYAQRFVSKPTTRDGLYWQAKAGEPESPIGKDFAAAQAKGYRVITAPAAGTGADNHEPRAYHGYRYKILTRQGTHALGGAYDYLVKGDMVGGFAMVAYPASYGTSGVMTFIVNHDGQVFQKDLGPKTEAIATAMTTFDPDSSWVKQDTRIAAN